MPDPASGNKGQVLALWITGCGQSELRPAPEPQLNAGEVLVRTLWSGISRGTERLVYEGRVPPAEAGRMASPLQEGSFPFPVKYGYCAVGVVEDGSPDLLGRTVFALHPHQNRFIAPVEMIAPVPEAIPPRRGVLAANMETALNALWDAGCGPADKIVVVGGGIVGLLVAYLSARLPGTDVTLVDIRSDRRAMAEALGVRFAPAGDAPQEADMVFHASASAEGLDLALSCGGFEASVVEMSWYGDREVKLSLGGAFHSKRLRLVSSQVGQVAPSRRPRWTHARRLQAAIALLDDPRLDVLVASEVKFEDLPQKLASILSPDADGLPPVVRYT
ncbi:zinc-dependent alcohol dehydrogenase [Microvirga brassicacearum]|uniref:zinc-dependent alcohol dehydrogenase n=1 Tax=Microvirga brassicacearum TaxID=2580413 RepID=UPI001911F5E9|nr:zinc-binding alcohol dehydrogenase [Microvirga brassicacearum]